jgi:hypothetical protein
MRDRPTNRERLVVGVGEDCSYPWHARHATEGISYRPRLARD